ncbi:MAG: class II glutamine amidotransferase [Polyangiales bacterium]
MCELLGMSANVPTDIVFSFTGLMQRGGRTGPHRDGFGIAFYEGPGVRLFHDPQPSVESEIAKLVQRYPIKSELVIAHIRQANVGAVCLANTHPFMRELWGRHFTFAHNGQVPDFAPRRRFYEPVGTTDSEALFCDLLDRLRESFPERAPLDALLPVLVEASRVYSHAGVFNCLLGNGEWLYAFASRKLACITRRAPFGAAHLSDADVSVDFQAETTPNDVVSVLATEPLTTNEVWHRFEPGEWRAFVAGECVASGRVEVPEPPAPSC